MFFFALIGCTTNTIFYQKREAASTEIEYGKKNIDFGNIEAHPEDTYEFLKRFR